MKKIFFIFCLSLFVFSCKKDPDTAPTGDINVRVTVNGYGLLKGANVYTNPPTVNGVTDEYGTVLLIGLKAGSYEIYASHDSVGSGKSAIYVTENTLNEVQINIIKGVFTGLAPIIELILPGLPAEFSTGENITFSADISDDKTPLQNITLKWESDKDGVINTSSPDISGNITFTKNNLSKGTHVIKITAKDSDGYISTRSFLLNTEAPQMITLTEAVKDQGKVNLKWEKYTGTDFLKYEVYRSDENCSSQTNTLLNTITDQQTVTFTDNLPPMEYMVCYHVKVTNQSNKSRNSNNLTVDNPSGYIFNFTAKNLLKHPTQHYVYLLDQAGQKLIKFNYDLMQVEKEVTLQGSIGNCDIGENGFGIEIYVPSSDGWIYVYDADNLSLKTSVNAGLQVGSVVTNGLGHIIASLYPSPWWEDPVRTFSRATGILIDGNGDFEGDRLRMIPGKNEIISITTSVSPIDMEYFLLDNNGMIVNHTDDTQHGDYPLDPYIFRISPNGIYTITSREGAVYYANPSMEYKGQLQHGSLNFSDFAFSDDGSIIYAATSNRKSIQIGHYPSLIRDNEILTKGFPVFIIRDGNKIICLSKTNENSINTGIEIVDL